MYFLGEIGLYVEYNLLKNIVEYILLGKISEQHEIGAY
jgi:TfoX/Sxy family transcriptional regulator of competence genes